MWGYEDVTINRYINDGISVNQSSNSKVIPDVNNKLSSCNDEDELVLIPSVTVLNNIIKLICNLIDTDGTLVIKWAQLALNTGVNCTHRHYASRSLQVCLSDCMIDIKCNYLNPYIFLLFSMLTLFAIFIFSSQKIPKPFENHSKIICP